MNPILVVIADVVPKQTQQMTLVLSDPEALRTFAREQARIWGAVVRENNIKADE